MTRRFDLVVVGSGSAAGTVASRCRAAGWSVAMIDRRPFGGTCALRGCDPKKVLIAAAAVVDASRALSGKGVSPNGGSIDWTDLMRFKRTFTDPLPERRRASLARAGIETFDGIARFAGPARVKVDDLTLEAARAIVIAAGAKPAALPIDGREHLTTSDEFLEQPSLPRSVAFVGGGYISFEFAHVAARAGARVTILHRGARPLDQFDADLVDRLVAATRAAGIDVRLGVDVRAVERTGDRYRIVSDAGTEAVTVDLVVHGGGRVPDLDDLALEAGGVEHSPAGVRVDDHLRSVSNPMVWAAGDCAATEGPALTPVAGYEGRIVAANLLDGPHATADYRVVPSVVFTLPPLARVGLTEQEAQRRGMAFTARSEDTSAWYSSRRLGATTSAFKVLTDDSSGRVLGAHLLGPLADETINLFALAMRAGMTADAIKGMLWAYPTHGSDLAYMV